jgi:hypothetical protein
VLNIHLRRGFGEPFCDLAWLRFMMPFNLIICETGVFVYIDVQPSPVSGSFGCNL